jgi:ribose 5-phosphate isomerase B
MKLAMLKVLTELRLVFEDFGTHTMESTDYPIWGKLVGEKVASGEFEFGLVFCGSGIGITIAANRVLGARAANCYDVTSARLAREHNNANVLGIGARTVGKETAADIVRTFFDAEFSGGERHLRRVQQLG